MVSSSPSNSPLLKVLRRFWPWFILLLALILATLMVVNREPRPPVQAQEKRFPVKSQLAEFSSFSPEIPLFGTVSLQALSTLAAPFSAEVKALTVKTGDNVQAGQLLLALDSTDINFLVGQRTASVAQLTAELQSEKNRSATLASNLASQARLLQLAEKEQERLRQLQQQKLASESQVEASEKALEQQKLILNEARLAVKNQPEVLKRLEAQRTNAQLALAQAENDQAKASIRAPFNATVTRINVGVGNRVNLGSPLLSLYSKKDLEVSALIPESQLALIRTAAAQGQTISAYAPELNAELSSEKLFLLKRLSSEVLAGSGGILAFFSLPSASPWVLGETLSLRLRLPAVAHSLRLPASALYQKRFLYRINPDDRLEAIQVRWHGEQQGSNGESLVIVQSLAIQPGDRIVTTNLPNAISGLLVQWQKPTDTANHQEQP